MNNKERAKLVTKAGLDDWHAINKLSNRWASIDIIFLTEEIDPIVRVDVGTRNFFGEKQAKLETISFILGPDNKVIRAHYLHS